MKFIKKGPNLKVDLRCTNYFFFLPSAITPHPMGQIDMPWPVPTLLLHLPSSVEDLNLDFEQVSNEVAPSDIPIWCQNGPWLVQQPDLISAPPVHRVAQKRFGDHRESITSLLLSVTLCISPGINWGAISLAKSVGKSGFEIMGQTGVTPHNPCGAKVARGWSRQSTKILQNWAMFDCRCQRWQTCLVRRLFMALLISQGRRPKHKSQTEVAGVFFAFWRTLRPRKLPDTLGQWSMWVGKDVGHTV